MRAEPDDCGTVAIGEAADCESASTVTVRINSELALPPCPCKRCSGIFLSSIPKQSA
jgi:hypothetical protein